MLVMALAMALFVLRVLGVADAFSFPPSLSSQDIPKHNPWPECYLCFPMGFFSDHVLMYTLWAYMQPFHHIKKGPFPQLEAH